MGLIKGIITPSGVVAENAYFRIEAINGDTNNVEFTLNSYLDRESFLGGKAILTSQSFSFVPDVSDIASNIFKQIYAFLKTIDTYADAIDVLEEGQNPISLGASRGYFSWG